MLDRRRGNRDWGWIGGEGIEVGAGGGGLEDGAGSQERG